MVNTDCMVMSRCVVVDSNCVSIHFVLPRKEYRFTAKGHDARKSLLAEMGIIQMSPLISMNSDVQYLISLTQHQTANAGEPLRTDHDDS